MTCWEILQLEPNATVEDVKRAYRSLAFSTHPDHGGTVDGFNRLSLAYSQAIEIAERPVLCSKCNGIGSIQARTSFSIMVCPECKGAGSRARE